jgi:hypothetical protein
MMSRLRRRGVGRDLAYTKVKRYQCLVKGAYVLPSAVPSVENNSYTIPERCQQGADDEKIIKAKLVEQELARVYAQTDGQGADEHERGDDDDDERPAVCGEIQSQSRLQGGGGR